MSTPTYEQVIAAVTAALQQVWGGAPAPVPTPPPVPTPAPPQPSPGPLPAALTGRSEQRARSQWTNGERLQSPPLTSSTYWGIHFVPQPHAAGAKVRFVAAENGGGPQQRLALIYRVDTGEILWSMPRSTTTVQATVYVDSPVPPPPFGPPPPTVLTGVEYVLAIWNALDADGNGPVRSAMYCDLFL